MVVERHDRHCGDEIGTIAPRRRAAEKKMFEDIVCVDETTLHFSVTFMRSSGLRHSDMVRAEAQLNVVVERWQYERDFKTRTLTNWLDLTKCYVAQTLRLKPNFGAILLTIKHQ